jgi:hypothetical protein
MERGGRFFAMIKTRCVPKSERKKSLNMGQFSGISARHFDRGDTICQASAKLCDCKKRGWSRTPSSRGKGACALS